MGKIEEEIAVRKMPVANENDWAVDKLIIGRSGFCWGRSRGACTGMRKVMVLRELEEKQT